MSDFESEYDGRLRGLAFDVGKFEETADERLPDDRALCGLISQLFCETAAFELTLVALG